MLARRAAGAGGDAALRRHPPDGRPRAVRARGGARRPVRGAAVGAGARRGRRAVAGPGPGAGRAVRRRTAGDGCGGARRRRRAGLARAAGRGLAGGRPARRGRGPRPAADRAGPAGRDPGRGLRPGPVGGHPRGQPEPVAHAAHRAARTTSTRSCTRCTRSHDDPEWARNALREVLVRGNAGRARLPGKHGGRSTTYAVVPVVVPDRPGELARLVNDVGDVRGQHRGPADRALARAAGRPGRAGGRTGRRGGRGGGAGAASAGSCTRERRNLLGSPPPVCRGSRMPTSSPDDARRVPPSRVGRRGRRPVRLGQVQRVPRASPSGSACATSTPARCTAR